MSRYICIHGHFYQPPRENPWLESVVTQDSAYPYHDWNGRITAECYAPNTAARILDGAGLIDRVVDNYSHISFNMGPTLLSWLQQHDAETYSAIISADGRSRERFGGHGSAMAQAYNHLIMPLANRRDKVTQVVWGLRDFEHRFGRPAAGMWLPETAVDIETLDIMAEHGVQFTVLAPHQAQRVRPLAGGDWSPVDNASIDPSRAYLQRLPSGRSICLFFYDGPISRGIAFDDLLGSGQRLASRLTAAFDPARTWPQLVHVATDGETYGHHHRFGDMALAHATVLLQQEEDVQLTNYAEFLALHPPTYEVAIAANTAWSCAHGVERWRSDCGCSTGGQPGWRQARRAPLRQALDALRDQLAEVFERHAEPLLPDPWQARTAYIHLMLDRSPEARARFLEQHTTRRLDEAETAQALKLLEMQRHALQMFTSCGWFFDDISGIEAGQVLQYAARAIELAKEVDGSDFEPGFLAALAAARSNLPEYGDGADVYRRNVAQARVTWERAGAHFGICQLLRGTREPSSIHQYRFEPLSIVQCTGDIGRMVAGGVKVTSLLTGDNRTLEFAAVEQPDGQVICRVQAIDETGATHAGTALVTAFDQDTPHDFWQRFNHSFTGEPYLLDALFPDEGRQLLAASLDRQLAAAGAVLLQFYPSYATETGPLTSAGAPPPPALQPALQAVLHADLERLLAQDDASVTTVAPLLRAAEHWRVALDDAGLAFTLTTTLNRVAAAFGDNPHDVRLLTRLAELVALVRSPATAIQANLWQTENTVLQVADSVLQTQRRAAARGAQDAVQWVEQVRELAVLLRLPLRDEG